MAGNGISRFSATVLEATTAADFRTAIGASGGSSSGDVEGPASAVDNRIATFDGTTGKLIQDSGTLVSDLSLASHTHALDELDPPTTAVSFNDQQATSFRIENRTSDPVSPTVGQIWLRTDL